MKALFMIVAILALGYLANVGYRRGHEQAEAVRAKSAAAMQGLRAQVLTMDARAPGVTNFVGTNQVWGVVMDMSFNGATVTLVALADGNASLYFSDGGGILGGIGHPAVRAAAARLSEVADAFVSQCEPATEFPFPPEGVTAFYILMKGGKATAQAREEDLGDRQHPLSPLFCAGQEVITELRQATNPPPR